MLFILQVSILSEQLINHNMRIKIANKTTLIEARADRWGIAYGGCERRITSKRL